MKVTMTICDLHLRTKQRAVIELVNDKGHIIDTKNVAMEDKENTVSHFNKLFDIVDVVQLPDFTVG